VISIFLVIALIAPGKAPVERHRLAMPSAEECVRRGANMAEQLGTDFRRGMTISIACEFTKH
jgi:hypothetical protein